MEFNERRADYPRILDALESIRQEMTRVATQVEERNSTALQWRADVCKKFDKIFQWLENLPCDKRESRYLSQCVQIKWLWIALTFIVGIMGWYIITFLTHLTK